MDYLLMYDDEELIEIAREYADTHAGFDGDFIYSLSEAMDKYDGLTDRQSEALRNVVKRFRMVKEKRLP